MVHVDEFNPPLSYCNRVDIIFNNNIQPTPDDDDKAEQQ